MDTDTPTISAPLSGRRKAAVVVQLLLGHGGKLALNQLPIANQEALAREMGDIRLVDRSVVRSVAHEFAQKLGDVGLAATGGLDAAITALTDHIDPNLAKKMREDLKNSFGVDPWISIIELDEVQLHKLFTRESTEVCAITLSKLPVGKAAEVLESISGDRARRITLAISKTEKTAPDIVTNIGRALVTDYCVHTPHAFDKVPTQRVGAILNSANGDIRDAMLEGLNNDDPGFAADVRKAIFTFKDIPARVLPTDIPAVTREVPPEELTIALASALQSDAEMNATAEFIFANISQRMAGQIRDEASELGQIEAKSGDKAQRGLTSAIRSLADSGAITLQYPSDDDETS